MWFKLTRAVFWGIALIVTIIVLKKIKTDHKKLILILLFIITIGLYSLSGFVLVENEFVTFPSPQLAYYYGNSDRIETIIDGEVSTLILTSGRNATSHEIIPKAEGGWKLGRGSLDQNKIIEISMEQRTVFIYQYKDTDDYYVIIWDPFSTDDGILEISDNRESTFEYFSLQLGGTNYFDRTYAAYIKNFTEEYEIIINGEILKFNNKE